MLTKLFKSPVRVRELRDGRNGPLLEGFAHKLCQTGYAESSARAHILAAEQLIYWTDCKAIAVATLNDSVIDGFGRHLHRCRSPRYGHTRRIIYRMARACSWDTSGAPVPLHPQCRGK